jgi:phage-related tail fiber protein
MYFDGINLAEGSVVTNLTVASGPSFPESSSIGELFYLTGANAGLYLYDGSAWVDFAAAAAVDSLSDVPFIVKTANSAVPNALVLGSLGAGFVKNSGTAGTLTSVPSVDLSSSDVSGVLASARFPALSGDVTSSAGSTAVTLSATGVAPGTYNKITVDAKGRVTSAVQATSLAQLGITDGATLTGSGSQDFTARNMTLTGDLLPAANGTQNIGSASLRWSTIFVNEAKLSTNTLYIGETPIMGTSGDTINIKADPNQSINMQTSGTGSTLITSGNQVQISTSGMNADVIVQATGAGSDVRFGSGSTIQFTAPTSQFTGDTAVSGNSSVGGNLTITGNLTVNGTNTVVNSSTVTTKDNIILVNAGEVGSGVTSGKAGIQVDRGDMADYQIVFDETDDMFKVGQIGQLETLASQNYVQSYAAPVGHVGTGGSAHANATGSVAGFMSASDKSKLDGVAAGANLYVHPTSGVGSGTYAKVTVDTNGHVTAGASLVAGDIPSLDWSKIGSGKPTTLAGYGITDAVSANAAITSGTYTKLTVDSKGLVTAGASLVASDIPSLDWSKITTGKPTTISGYGITDAYTKTETDSRIQAVVGAAPAALDTLAEIATQLANDESAVSALTTTVSGKLDSSEVVATVSANKVLRLDSTGKLPASITGNAATATNVAWSGVTGTPTTLAGYGITDAYTKTATDSAISTAIAGVQSGNVSTATSAGKLTTARTIEMSGDVSWSVSFDGSANVTAAGTLANSGVTAGTYPKVTVNAKGLVTGGASLVASDIPVLDWSKITTGKPTTAAGYGIGDVYTKTEVDSSLSGKINTTAVGVANGVASLGSDGKVPAVQLPSYVDDVLEYAATGNFPATGETGKIYVATGTNKTYRWSGSVYVEISAAPGSTDAVVEGTTNLYYTDARAQAAIANVTIDGGSY